METDAMPNRRYSSGVRLEREIRQILEEKYNIPCLRTAGSKSDFDLIALGRRTILIQVKYTSRKNIKASRAQIQKVKKYLTGERWAVIIVVQRHTRLTNITWVEDNPSPLWGCYELCTHDNKTAKFHDAMYKLNQLCSGYEIDNT
jgi:Holliday junction resolvase